MTAAGEAGDEAEAFTYAAMKPSAEEAVASVGTTALQIEIAAL